MQIEPHKGQAWRNYPHAPPKEEQIRHGRNQVCTNYRNSISTRIVKPRNIFKTRRYRMVSGEINLELDTGMKYKYLHKSRSFGKKNFKRSVASCGITSPPRGFNGTP